MEIQDKRVQRISKLQNKNVIVTFYILKISTNLMKTYFKIMVRRKVNTLKKKYLHKAYNCQN